MGHKDKAKCRDCGEVFTKLIDNGLIAAGKGASWVCRTGVELLLVASCGMMAAARRAWQRYEAGNDERCVNGALTAGRDYRKLTYAE